MSDQDEPAVIRSVDEFFERYGPMSLHWARIFDVPPWLLGHPKPRFARMRWALRRVWPLPK